jgi:hypothetical protein
MCVVAAERDRCEDGRPCATIVMPDLFRHPPYSRSVGRRLLRQRGPRNESGVTARPVTSPPAPRVRSFLVP